MEQGTIATTERVQGARWFGDFDEAREWAADNVKGYPSWRVGTWGGWFTIELIPGALWVQHEERTHRRRQRLFLKAIDSTLGKDYIVIPDCGLEECEWAAEDRDDELCADLAQQYLDMITKHQLDEHVYDNLEVVQARREMRQALNPVDLEHRCESSFSWSNCECCGTSVGGERQTVRMVHTDNGYEEKIDVCIDCMEYWEDGKLPERWEEFEGQFEELRDAGDIRRQAGGGLAGTLKREGELRGQDNG